MAEGPADCTVMEEGPADCAVENVEVAYSKAKRQVEEAECPESPVVKRLKPSAPELVDNVISALRHADLPLNGKLRDYLLATAPAALEIQRDKRGASEETLLPLLKDIFVGEEPRLKACITASQNTVDKAITEKKELDVALQKVESNLEAKRSELSDGLQAIPEDVASIRDAEDKFRQALRQLLEKERDICMEIKRDSVEPLTCSSWTSASDREKHLVTLKTLCIKINADSSLVDALPDVLSKPLEERCDFDRVLVKFLEDGVAKYVSNLDVDVQVVASAATCGDVTDTSMAMAEQLFNLNAARKKARVTIPILEAMQEKFNQLKASSRQQSPEEHKRNVEAFVSTFTSELKEDATIDSNFGTELVAALDENMEERSQDSSTVVQKAEDALKRHIASQKDGFGEVVVAGELLGRISSKLQRILALENKLKQDMLKPLKKERDAAVAVRDGAFSALCAGTLETNAKVAGAVRKLNTFVKKLDLDSVMVNAAVLAFKVKPEERSVFQSRVVEQLGEQITTRCAALDTQIQQLDAAVASSAAEQNAAASAASAAVEAAYENQRLKLQKLLGASNECDKLVTTLHERKDAVAQHGAKQEQALAQHVAQQGLLQQLERAQQSLEDLL